MSEWRRIASEKLPGLQKLISNANSPIALWNQLSFELTRAYEQKPIDEKRVAAIYDYAYWCLTHPRNDDLNSAVCVCFYEDLPTHPLVRRDLARWLSSEDFDGLQSIFAYHLDKKEQEAFVREFRERKKLLASTKLR